MGMRGRGSQERLRKVFLATVVVAVVVTLFGCDIFFRSAPTPPTGVAASDGTFADKVRILWNAVEGAASYRVYRATSENGVYAKIGETTATLYDDASVTPNVVYWYKVKACNAAGCSDYSAPDSGYAQSAVAGAPPAPTGVSATDGTYTDRVRVTWNEVPGATRYEIYRDTSAGGIFPLRGTSDTPSFDDTDVIPGRTYWYRVRACNPSGCSVLSAADSGYAEPVIPDTPSGVSATDGTYEDRVQVSWNEVSGAATYEIYRATAQDGTYTKIGEDPTSPYDDTNVTVGTTYWYKVKACNAAGCSPLSDADSGYAQTGGGGTPTTPGRPTGVSATDGTYADKVHVSWNAVSGATSYQVFRALTEGGSYTQIAETTETSYDDFDDLGSPVTPCVTYWYKVRACANGECSDLSDADGGYRGTKVTGVPTNVQASDGTYTDKVHITWDAVTGAGYYEIWRSTDYAGTYTDIAQTSSTTYDDTTAAIGTTYWYKIKACSDEPTCGCGGFSIPESGYRSCKPDVPTNVTATGQAGPQIVINWNAVSDPGFGTLYYEIYRADTATGPYTKIGQTTSTTYTDGDVTTGNTYYYKVKACNDCGCSDLSDPAAEATAP